MIGETRPYELCGVHRSLEAARAVKARLVGDEYVTSRGRRHIVSTIRDMLKNCSIPDIVRFRELVDEEFDPAAARVAVFCCNELLRKRISQQRPVS